MTSTNFVGSGKAIIHVNHGTVHGRLFYGLASKLDVLCHQQEYDLVGNHLLRNESAYTEQKCETTKNTHICEAKFGQELTDVAAEIALERLLAGDKRQATSELLSHKMTGLAELVLVRLRDEVLCNQLPGGNASDSDGPLDNGKDDLEITHMNTYN